MFNTQSLTVSNCIIRLILIKLCDGAINDSMNEILGTARNC